MLLAVTPAAGLATPTSAPARVEVPLPPGFGSLAVLDRVAHAGLSIAPQVGRFAAQLHAIYISVPEFVAAAKSCPVVFAEAGRDAWQPMMLTGLKTGQNLCTDAAGDWRADIYCPAYVRRYPFCTAKVARGDLRTVICVDVAGLSDGAPPLFNEVGEETRRWQEIQQLIQEMETAARQTDVFCARLAELGLLESFNADIRPATGPPQQVSGLWRVNESRLNTLPPNTLTELMRSGFLSRIYAHLMSLDNFQRLLALQVA